MYGLTDSKLISALNITIGNMAYKEGSNMELRTYQETNITLKNHQDQGSPS